MAVVGGAFLRYEEGRERESTRRTCIKAGVPAYSRCNVNGSGVLALQRKRELYARACGGRGWYTKSIHAVVVVVCLIGREREMMFRESVGEFGDCHFANEIRENGRILCYELGLICGLFGGKGGENSL